MIVDMRSTFDQIVHYAMTVETLIVADAGLQVVNVDWLHNWLNVYIHRLGRGRGECGAFVTSLGY